MAEARWSAWDLIDALTRVHRDLSAAEEELGRLDGLAGDGDLGVTLSRGFAKVTVALAIGQPATPSAVLEVVSATLATEAPSTMGTLLAAGFREAAEVVSGRDGIERDDVVALLEAAAVGVTRRGDAEAGDRTVLDAMLPAIDAARSTGAAASVVEVFAMAADGAALGAEATRAMEPRIGRASWVGTRVLGSPDAGAVAWSMILQAIAAPSADVGA